MHKKSLLLILIICIILSIAFSTSASADNVNKSNLLLLKAEHIDTKNNSGAYDRSNNDNNNNASLRFNAQSVQEEQYYIVQFTGPVQEKWTQNVTSAGANMFGYVPYNAFIIRMNEDVKNKVQSMDFVQWIGEYKSSYKYDPELINESDIQLASAESDNSNKIYTVMLFQASDYTRVTAEIESIGGTIVSGAGTTLRVEIRNDKIPEIADIYGVSWIEKYSNTIILNNDVATTIINADDLHHNYSLNGSGQIVAVCDSGLDNGSITNLIDDFRGRVLNLIDIIGDGSTADQLGHGTHVAGSVLGSGLYPGMAPEAELIFVAIGTGSNIFVPSNFSELFQQAYDGGEGYDEGARIHTNSWGYHPYTYEYGSYPEPSQLVDQFMWDHPDMLILFSAGNYGTTNSIGVPGTAKNCLTVGATENYRPENSTNADNINDIAYFSSRGPTNDGRYKPDVVAPGTWIASVRSSQATSEAISDLGAVIINDNYVYMSGTSMSTPIVAGSAALVRQYYVDIENETSPSAALIKATLINGAYDVTESTGRPDYSQGWGRVDVENSIYPEQPTIVRYFDKISLTTGDSWNVSYDVADASETLRATLVWTDYPGEVYADPALVNNLDLIITCPDGTYYGNGGSEDDMDDVNNVEGIELTNLVGGTYTFTVVGTDVATMADANVMEPQNFSLVLSFEPGHNEYPQNNSYTNNNTTAVSAELISLYGINTSTINMTVDGTEVIYNLTTIDDGYRVENVTAHPYSEGQHNVSVTALTNQSELISYNWTFYEDFEAPALSDLTNSRGPLSVSFAWSQTEDTEHVELWRNGIFIVNSSTSEVTDTGLAPSTTYNYGLKPVDFAGNIGDWTNTTVTTLTMPVISNLSTSSTTSAVTFTWNQSDDTEHVELWRNGALVVNSSTSPVTDTGLSSSTTYEYALRPIDLAGTYGNWTNTTVTTSSIPTTSSSSGGSSGGGGGGGGGSSGEDTENIEFKDVLSVYTAKGEVTDFDFDDENNDINYVRYTSLKNAGKISVTIEILKNNSAFADSPVSGEIYRYMNIWVGKTGYAIEANIADPVIGFKVSKEWIENNDIDPETIILNRYSDDAWGALSTTQTDSDDQYIYFEASTPGFSPFAITANEPDSAYSDKLAEEQVIATSSMSQNDTNSTYEEGNGENSKLPPISAITTLIIVAIAGVILQKQQN